MWKAYWLLECLKGEFSEDAGLACERNDSNYLAVLFLNLVVLYEMNSIFYCVSE